MKPNLTLSTRLAVLLCCSFIVILTALANGDQHAATTQRDESAKPPTALDYTEFKQRFNKQYDSLVEEMSRMKLFWARYFDSLRSYLAYQLKGSTWYRRVNQFSDLTPEEIRQRLAQSSQVRDGPDSAEAGLGDGDGSKLSDVLPEEPTENAADVENELDEGRMMPESAVRLSTQNKGPISEEVVKAGVATRKKRDLTATLERERRSKGKKGDIRMTVDHRECFGPVKDQGGCGCGHVFSVISVLEYHYCKENGHHITFSEQYPLNCLKSGFPHYDTCKGEESEIVFSFIQEHGLDRPKVFPYVGRVETCVFGQPPLRYVKEAGFWRVTGLSLRHVRHYAVEWEIKDGPILVRIAIDEDFMHYGGGIHTMRRCNHKERLTDMVIVGRGQEDGTDFWLLRNSFGNDWGENGYSRISEQGLKQCMYWDSYDSSSYGNPYVIEQNDDDFLGFEKNPDYNNPNIKPIRRPMIRVKALERKKKQRGDKTKD